MSSIFLPRIFCCLQHSFRPIVTRQNIRLSATSTTTNPPRRNANFSTKIMQHRPDNDRGADSGRKKKKPDQKAEKLGGNDEVLQLDVTGLLARHARTPSTSAEGTPDEQQAEETTTPVPALPTEFTEIEVKISELSSTGDGLALSPTSDHVYVVPFTVPGDTVKVKVVKHFHKLGYTTADFVEVVDPSPQRDDSIVGCKYFSKCSGCQFQMLSYPDQLAHKKRIVEKAFANFSGIIPELIPAIGDTMPSPMQYGYRTKLTPHFALPGGGRGKKTKRPTPTEVPPIGFTLKNRRQDMDIEDCPLGTDIVRRGLKRERKRVAKNIMSYKRGATLLLRESTTRESKTDDKPKAADDADGEREASTPADPKDEDVIRKEYPEYIEEKRCITDSNDTSVEYVEDYKFFNKAGAFFQNNNSILPSFTSYIRDHALPPTTSGEPAVKYLLDAYSGSGLFTVTLSSLFKSSLGIDIAEQSIVAARQNARANNLSNTGFAAADAVALFRDVPYPSDQTLLIIDPPRKGCDGNFLQQMLTFGPRRVIYVSCNVHTQARDIGVMVLGDEKWRYEIESIKGFDFFPQTGHVEGVAVLNRVPAKELSA